MLSFSRGEITAIRTFCQLYINDGLPSQKYFDRISTRVQKNLISSALHKLSDVLTNQELTRDEATVLCMAFTYALNNYEIGGDQADLIAMYNRLADHAGFPA